MCRPNRLCGNSHLSSALRTSLGTYLTSGKRVNFTSTPSSLRCTELQNLLFPLCLSADHHDFSFFLPIHGASPSSVIFSIAVCFIQSILPPRILQKVRRYSPQTPIGFSAFTILRATTTTTPPEWYHDCRHRLSETDLHVLHAEYTTRLDFSQTLSHRIGRAFLEL